jgi:hypothetical protein
LVPFRRSILSSDFSDIRKTIITSETKYVSRSGFSQAPWPRLIAFRISMNAPLPCEMRGEIAADPIEHEAQKADFAVTKTLERDLVDISCKGQELILERYSALGQMNMDLASVIERTAPLNVTAAFHILQLFDRGLLHGTHALAQLPLCQTVLLPERSEEEPHADRDVVGGQSLLQILSELPMGQADCGSDAEGERIVDLRGGSGTAVVRTR